MTVSGALPRSGGGLFRVSSAPTIGPRGGRSAYIDHQQKADARIARRVAKSGSTTLVILPRPELYKQHKGGYQGTTFGPPPGRPFRSRETGFERTRMGLPFNHDLPDPALYKKNTTANRGSGIGRWSFGPGHGKPTPPRLRPTSAELVTKNAYLNYGFPDPVLYREPRQMSVLFAKPSSRPPSPTDSAASLPPVMLSTTASAAGLVRPRPRSAAAVTPTREQARFLAPTPQSVSVSRPATPAQFQPQSRGSTPQPTTTPESALSRAATVPASPTPLMNQMPETGAELTAQAAETAAATTVQAAVRGHSARAEAAKAKGGAAEKLAAERATATTVQAAGRGQSVKAAKSDDKVVAAALDASAIATAQT